MLRNAYGKSRTSTIRGRRGTTMKTIMTTTAITIITAIVITTITITKYEIYYTRSRAARPYGDGVEYNRNGVRTATDYVSNYTADCWRIAWPPLLAAAHANAIPFVSAADEGSAPVIFFSSASRGPCTRIRSTKRHSRDHRVTRIVVFSVRNLTMIVWISIGKERKKRTIIRKPKNANK